MKKHPAKTTQIVNRRANFDYKLGDKLIVGMVLAGNEVRAARDNHISLKGAFVTIRNQELWLNNASFTLKNIKDSGTTVSTNPRKLLATKRQISELLKQKQAGMTIVPTRMLTSGRHIKLEIAVGAGKKLYDKRQDIKKRDIERETRRFY
ncbi:MAG: SsrA-binding protein SmpB [Candidatus Saccharibacteria bacterium]|nr:SsrA-binding protein SmpB [Candidatus Saccharibacteria bacterium]